MARLGSTEKNMMARKCICCDAGLTGMFGSFEGRCSKRGYPARAIHRIEGVGTLGTVVLQYHPNELSFVPRVP
jgi:hypothetical protein